MTSSVVDYSVPDIAVREAFRLFGPFTFELGLGVVDKSLGFFPGTALGMDGARDTRPGSYGPMPPWSDEVMGWRASRQHRHS